MIYRIFNGRKSSMLGAGANFGTGGAMRSAGVLLLAMTVLVSVPGWSQTTTGRLMGKIVDESGAVLPDVNITISSPALIGGAQVKTTDNRGEFLFLALGPGTYSVKAESSGFVTQERNLVEVPSTRPRSTPVRSFAPTTCETRPLGLAIAPTPL